MELKLGHPSEKGGSIQVDQFELSVEDAPLIGPKKIAVRTVFFNDVVTCYILIA